MTEYMRWIIIVVACVVGGMPAWVGLILSGRQQRLSKDSTTSWTKKEIVALALTPVLSIFGFVYGTYTFLNRIVARIDAAFTTPLPMPLHPADLTVEDIDVTYYFSTVPDIGWFPTEEQKKARDAAKADEIRVRISVEPDGTCSIDVGDSKHSHRKGSKHIVIGNEAFAFNGGSIKLRRPPTGLGELEAVYIDGIRVQYTSKDTGERTRAIGRIFCSIIMPGLSGSMLGKKGDDYEAQQQAVVAETRRRAQMEKDAKTSWDEA